MPNEIDPEEIIKISGIPGDYTVDYRNKAVRFTEYYQLIAMASYLHKYLPPGRNSFSAYNWLWQVETKA